MFDVFACVANGRRNLDPQAERPRSLGAYEPATTASLTWNGWLSSVATSGSMIGLFSVFGDCSLSL